MKKVFTLIAAVVLFATAAMAETIAVTGHKTSKATATGAVQYGLTASGMTFYFAFELDDVVNGTTYTYSDMMADYTWCDDGGNGMTITDGSFLKTDDTHFTASATCSDGNVYNITIAPLDPITDPIAVINVNITDPLTSRLYDGVAKAGVFQFYGATADKAFYAYMAIQNATAIPGTYTEANIYSDYTTLYIVDGDDATAVELNNILGNIVVTETDGVYSANMRYVGTDSIEYNITFVYSDPTAETQYDFNSTDLTVEPNENYDLYEFYSGYYVYDIQATNNDYIFYGMLYSEDVNIANTYDFADGNLDVAFYQNNDGGELAYEPFSGSVTLSYNDGAASITGAYLVYGNVNVNINATGTIVTDVENVETSKYAVLSEKNGVMVCGAEGEVVALYDMAGRMIQSVKATSDNVRINVAVPGVYVVKVNGEAIRAIVK